MVRSSDKKSPREAVEFILQLLKYNDNSGNTYSDVFWVAALVQSVGELEFGQQVIIYLPSLLKRLDRLLQFDWLMPSHNGILTISCIQSLTQMALKLSEFIPLDRVIELIQPYQMSKMWQIRVAASRALLELEFQCKGTDTALALFIRYLNNETSLRGQTKIGVCALRLAQMTNQPDCDSDVKSDTLVTLLRLLESPLAFNNVTLRHYIFCILQVLARRSPTLYGVPRDETLRMGHTKTCSELKNIFAALIHQSKTPDPSYPPDHPAHNLTAPENYPEINTYLGNHDTTNLYTTPLDTSLVPADCIPEHKNSFSYPTEEVQTALPNLHTPAESQPPIEQVTNSLGDANIEQSEPLLDHLHDHNNLVAKETINDEPDTVSNSHEIKKPKLKIRVKQSNATSRAEDPDNARHMNFADRGVSSSVSVDAPHRNNLAETISTGNQNPEDASSCQDVGSRVTASIGSAKPTATEGEELVKELQCTADSSKIDVGPQTSRHDLGSPCSKKPSGGKKEKEKKKNKEKKRKRNGHNDDPDRLERKRQKKEKKRKEKELAKLLTEKTSATPSSELPGGGKRVVGVDVEAETTVVEPTSSTKELYKTDVQIKPGEANVAVNRNDGGINSNPPSAPSQVQIKPGEVNVAVNRNDGGINSNPPSTPSQVQIKPGEANVAVNSNDGGINSNPPSAPSQVQIKPGEANVAVNRNDGVINSNPPSAPSHKIKIKFKNRTLGKQ